MQIQFPEKYQPGELWVSCPHLVAQLEMLHGALEGKDGSQVNIR